MSATVIPFPTTKSIRRRCDMGVGVPAPGESPLSWLPLIALFLWLPKAYKAKLWKLWRLNRCLRCHLSRARHEARRLERLRAFFSPSVRDLILSSPVANLPRVYRHEVTVVFLDLRGFTAFTQTSDPEEVMRVLHAFHADVGELVHTFGGTIERFTGDGLMAFFNAPVPISAPAESAVRMALNVRERFRHLRAHWRARGHDLDLGIGIAHGLATVGIIGFEGRWDYGVIGTVTNLAARLCAEARGSEILASPPVVAPLGDRVETEFVGPLVLKNFVSPVPTFRILSLRENVGCRLPRERGNTGSSAERKPVIDQPSRILAPCLPMVGAA